MKLISPDGQIVSASTNGARVLLGRGYKPYNTTVAAELAPEPQPAGLPDTHADLDKIAAGIDGFEWPKPPAGKTRLTVAEKQAALTAAGWTPDSE